LPENFIQRKGACAFDDGVKNGGMKQCLFMGGERFVDEAHNQALELELAKVTSRPLAMMQEEGLEPP
jgi:hypothetical protein